MLQHKKVPQTCFQSPSRVGRKITGMSDSELFLCILRWIPLCQHFCFVFVLLEHLSTHALPPSPWLQLMVGQLKSARDETMNEIWAIPKLGHTPKLQFLH